MFKIWIGIHRKNRKDILLCFQKNKYYWCKYSTSLCHFKTLTHVNNRYGQLNLKTKEWRRVDKQLIKSLASVLELKDWRVLIDHEMDKEYEKNQIKARDYLEKIKEIEKNIKEENPEQYEEEYSVFNVVGN